MFAASPGRLKRSHPAFGSRRGVAALALLLGFGVLVALTALVVNLAWLTCHQVRLRAAGQAAALAGAAELLDPSLPGADLASGAAGGTAVGVAVAADPATAARIALAEQQARAFAARNGVALQTTSGSAAAGAAGADMVAGWVENPASPTGSLTAWNGAGPVNSLWVRAARRRSGGDAVTLWLGRLFGLATAEPAAAARASIDQRVYGFRPAGHVRVPLVPLLVSSSTRWPCGAPVAPADAEDHYGVDPRTREVRPAADGIGEITLRTAAAGNAAAWSGDAAGENAAWFCLAGETADFAQLADQVTQGLTLHDLEPLGNMFALGNDGRLLVGRPVAADSGQLAGLQQALWAIRGQERIWPVGSLLSQANQTRCQVEGFVAGRVVDCCQEADSRLTIVVQACTLQTCTALTRSGTARNPWIGKLILHE